MKMIDASEDLECCLEELECCLEDTRMRQGMNLAMSRRIGMKQGMRLAWQKGWPHLRRDLSSRMADVRCEQKRPT